MRAVVAAAAAAVALSLGPALADEKARSQCQELVEAPLLGEVPALSDGLHCLAMNVYFESRRLNDAGQAAVAFVVLNRIADGRYPKSFCDVVHQGSTAGAKGCQFSWSCDGLDHTVRDVGAWKRAVRNACTAVLGRVPDPTKGAIAYHARTMQPDWARSWIPTAIVDGHIFYTDRKPAQ